jgi:hypothetical protein
MQSAFLYYCGSLDEFTERVKPFINLREDKKAEGISHEAQAVKYFTRDDAFIALLDSDKKRLVNKLSKLQRSLSVPRSSKKSSKSKHQRRESFSSRILLDLDSFEHDSQTFPFLCAVLGDYTHFDEKILSRFYTQCASFTSQAEEEYLSWIQQDIFSNSLRAFRIRYSNRNLLFYNSVFLFTSRCFDFIY